MVRGVAVAVVANLTGQGAGSDGQDLGGWPANWDEANLFVNVTAVSGTPTLDVKYQCGPSASNNDYDHTSMPQITGTGKHRLGLTQIGSFGRVDWTIGGVSPSIDFTIEIEGKQVNRR